MKITKLYQHFWFRNVALFTFLFILLLLGKEDGSSIFLKPNQIISTFITLFIAYAQFTFHNVFLFDRLLLQKKERAYLLSLILLAFGFTLLNYYTPYKILFGPFPVIFVGSFLTYIFSIGLFMIHKNILSNYFVLEQKLFNKEEEVRALKSQLNPHFLFNSLNNLYAEALTNPNGAADRILELSNLLRYQVEACKQDYVLLSEDVDYIKNYLKYERERNLQLKLSFNFYTDKTTYRIAPLLFMTFFDNAIKYSAEAASPEIKSEMIVKNGELKFTIENNYDASKNYFTGTKTGIENTRKRLALIYEGKHELSITSNNQLFTVHFKLGL